jgi:DNA-binding SARP family transcriptional activator
MIEIRLVGMLEVQGCILPASRKTRALLAYLVLTGRPHTREHLCDLLWDSPDDPRAALRWSLTKLRAVIGTERISCEGERIAFVVRDAQVDVATIRRLAGGTLDEQRRAGELLSGELCDGLYLRDACAYTEWLTIEREALRVLRRRVFGQLIERLPAEQALPWARRRLADDPLDADAHAEVVRLLGVLGRTADARAQHASGQRHLGRELAA